MIQLNMPSLKTSISIFIVLLLLFVFVPLASASDWPMFGHDAKHSGSSDASIQLPLKLLWKADVYGTSSSPVIVPTGIASIGGEAELYP